MSDVIIRPLKLDNPFSGRVATDYEAPFAGIHELAYTCGVCKQRVNARDLGQVFHHEQPGHKRIPPQEVT